MITRRIAQMFSAILYNANLISDIPGKYISGKLCVPGLNCMYCPASIAGCPLGIAQRIFSCGFKNIILTVLVSLFVFAILFGRSICGWACPFGLLQDFLDKVPLPKLKRSDYTHKLSYLKYIVGILFVIVLPMFYFYANNRQIQAFCQNLCPQNAFAMSLMSLSFGSFSSSALLLNGGGIMLLATVILSLFIYRPFCRFICPLGAFYGLFNKYALLSVNVKENKCVKCQACKQACRMDCKKIGDHECISCGKCKKACKFNAIQFGKTKITKKEV